MSTFYVRNMIRGNYSRFSNSANNSHRSSNTIRSQTPIMDDSHNVSIKSNVPQHLDESVALPPSISSCISIQENTKGIATESAIFNLRRLPDIDVNLDPQSKSQTHK